MNFLRKYFEQSKFFSYRGNMEIINPYKVSIYGISGHSAFWKQNKGVISSTIDRLISKKLPLPQDVVTF